MTLPSMIPLRAPSRLASILAAVLTVALLAAPTAVAEPPPRGEALTCGQDITRTDENGTIRLTYQCLPTDGVLHWSFTFNPLWKSQAISPVREDGMQFWRDGAPLPKNAQHLVPVDYIFHGSIPRVFVGNDIDYQNFFVFRADFGPDTGTARVAIAGPVILKP